MNENKGNKKPDIEMRISFEFSPDLQKEIDKREKDEKLAEAVIKIFGSLFFLSLLATILIVIFIGPGLASVIGGGLCGIFLGIYVCAPAITGSGCGNIGAY